MQPNFRRTKNIEGVTNATYTSNSDSGTETDFQEVGTRKRSVANKSNGQVNKIVEKPVNVVSEIPKKAEKPKYVPTWRKLIVSFSLPVNTGSLLDTHRHPAVIRSIDGIRAISMTWVIWGHTYFYAVNEIDNLQYVFGSFVNPLYQHISVAIFAVDTFFVLR